VRIGRRSNEVHLNEPTKISLAGVPIEGGRIKKNKNRGADGALSLDVLKLARGEKGITQSQCYWQFWGKGKARRKGEAERAPIRSGGGGE